MVLVAVGLSSGGQAATTSGGGNTYVMASEYIKGFGTTDTTVAQKKPKKYYVGTQGATFINAKLDRFKRWGTPTTRAKAKKLTICDPSQLDSCSTTKKGSKVIFKKPKSLTCDVKGQMRRVTLYTQVTAKQPKHKGYKKGRSLGTIFAKRCPQF